MATGADHDVAIVGAGILGLAVARELLAAHARAARRRGRQGGRRRDPPDRPQQRGGARRHLLRARLAEGAAVRRGSGRGCTDFCERHAIRFDRCGKLIVALDAHRAGPPGPPRGARARQRRPWPAAPARRGDRRGRAPRHGRRRTALAAHGDRRLPGRGAGACGGGARARGRAAPGPRGHRGAHDPRPAERRRAGRPRRRAAPPRPGARSSARAHGPTAWPWRPARPPTRASCPSAAQYLRLKPGARHLVRGLDLPGARPRAALPRRAPHPPRVG